MTSKAPSILLEDDTEKALPFRWEIRTRCDGHGASSAYLGCFTADRWNEHDDEWKEDYLAGRFDRPCGHCEGGKVRVLDRSRTSKDDQAEFDRQQQELADCEAEHRAERMFEGGWREEGWFDY